MNNCEGKSGICEKIRKDLTTKVFHSLSLRWSVRDLEQKQSTSIPAVPLRTPLNVFSPWMNLNLGFFEQPKTVKPINKRAWIYFRPSKKAFTWSAEAKNMHTFISSPSPLVVSSEYFSGSLHKILLKVRGRNVIEACEWASERAGGKYGLVSFS